MDTVAELLKKCETTKKCSACKQEKQLFEFSKNNANKDKLQYFCRTCDNVRQQKRRTENKDKIKDYSKQYRLKRNDDFEYRLKMLLNSSKQRALSKNREHTLTLEDLKELFPSDNKCPVFGFSLEFNSGGFRETSPSIDRIDSTKGYTRDNVQIISWKANRLKSYATVEELETLVAFMKQGD